MCKCVYGRIVRAANFCNTITEAAEKLLMCTQAAPSDGSGIEFSMPNSLSSTHAGALVRLQKRKGTGGGVGVPPSRGRFV